jgi:glucan phosphoethanolaminetransferase (alkaline phosphatase superfamily)
MKYGRLFCLVFAALLFAAPAFAASDMPNVIILSVDALRADHASCYGYCRATTPNIDRLAGQGVMFMDASALIPLTNPSIATLFTSNPAGPPARPRLHHGGSGRFLAPAPLPLRPG